MSIDNYWYSKNPLAYLLLPLSWLFRGVSGFRKWLYHNGLLSAQGLPVPVVVVGNINVGGTGKTPLVIVLAEILKEHGYRPGIITRGYGGEVKESPVKVSEDSDAYQVSDEAVLLAKRSGCPVVACQDRIASSKLLLEQNCNIILSDDGLQHYRLQRDIEIAVIDSARGLGNGFSLPAGPLREPAKRLASVDFIITNGESHKQYSTRDYVMRLQTKGILSLSDDLKQSIDKLTGMTVHAVAAIGNPARFFNQLRDLGLSVIENSFPDHYRYQLKDIEFDDDKPVIMTEKDAVKCRKLIDKDKYYYLSVAAEIDKDFTKAFLEKLKRL